MPSWLQAEEAQLVSDPMSSIGRVLFTLAGMIALILLLAYWAKRLQGASSSAGSFASSGKMIQTLATVSLGLKEKISLIQVGEQQLLIGITPQSIQTLLVLDKPIEQADIEQQTPVFQAILKKALNKT
jgi:flagellar protein FliO/FliZ